MSDLGTHLKQRMINIDDKRLTIIIPITGEKLMKNMKNWINYTGFDGSLNLHVNTETGLLKTPKEISSSQNNKCMGFNHCL